MNIEDYIRNIIKHNDYITIDQVMREVLSANIDSYYKRPNILGETGDFITSPEISQLFGETIGLWAIEQWQKLGCPSQINLVELGPGRGLLMRDLLRTAKLLPVFYNSINVKLLEINPYLIAEQKKNLAAFSDRSVSWINSLEPSEPIPAIFVANEFFDAMPITQYKKQNGLWFQVVLKIDSESRQFYFDKIPVDAMLQTKLTKNHINADNEAVVEESSQSIEIISAIAKHIKNFLGSALIIDYGYDLAPNLRAKNQYNSSLQAVKNHKYHAILNQLGAADLSAHVDFYALTKQAKEQGINTELVITQNQFLTKYGIDLRLASLCQKLERKEQNILRRQIERLTSKEQMGNLFKVMIINNYCS